MLGSGELVAWWIVIVWVAIVAPFLVLFMAFVAPRRYVCMCVSHHALCLLACTPHSYYYLLLLPSFLFLVLFCILFCLFLDLNPKREFLHSYHMVMTTPLRERKKSPEKKKTVWQALETASSKTHLQFSVDYYAQQWTGS
jgi:hypothetical protein